MEKARGLTQLGHRLHHRSTQQAEIAGALLKLDRIHQAVEHPIEPRRRGHLHQPFGIAVIPHRGDHLSAVAPGLHHRWNPLRRVLQVGIDQHRSGTAAVGIVQPRQHRGLLAEVAGELQQRDGRIGMALLPGTDHSNRGIGGTVINQQQMVHLRQGHDTLNEGADHLGFVEAGRHHPHLLAGHQCAVCTVWNRRAPGSVIGSAC